jgi:hypothetical protein
MEYGRRAISVGVQPVRLAAFMVCLVDPCGIEFSLSISRADQFTFLQPENAYAMKRFVFGQDNSVPSGEGA